METCYKVDARSTCCDRSRSKSNGFGIEPELTAKIFKRGYRVYEVPITLRRPRATTKGKKITWARRLRRACGCC